MPQEFIYHQLKQYRLAVLATVWDDYQPEAAVIGIAVTRQLEILFDTVRTSRKYRNLITQPKVALVIGWDNETTIQYEGEATELGPHDDSYREAYFAVFPDGRVRMSAMDGLTHFVIKPKWIRYSNFNHPVKIEEFIYQGNFQSLE